MSTKDLIDRLTQTSGTGRNSRTGASPGTGDPSKVKSTRVGARVIRRRRVAKKVEAPTLDTLASPPSEQPDVVEAEAPIEEPTPPSEEAAEAAPEALEEVEEAVEATPEAAPVVETAAAEDDSAETAEVAEAASTEDTTEEPSEDVAVEASPEETETVEEPVAELSPEPEPEVETEAKAKAGKTEDGESTESQEAQNADESEDGPSVEGEEATEDTQTAASKLAKSLPRAGGGAPGDFFPGLGSAVVRPPPGYDPNDPSGNRIRAQAAAEAAKQPKTGEKVWRDEKSATTPAGGKGRGRGHERGQDEMQAQRRQRPTRRARVQTFREEFTRRRRRTRSRGGPKKVSPQAKAIKRRVEVNGEITVANLAHGLSVKTSQVIKTLMAMDHMATANETIDIETAQLVATEYEYEVIDSAFQEDAHLIETEEIDENQQSRCPVVTIMGHVDHGKTTLLDTIRKANVAAGEAGGITQHTAAYQVERNGDLITFIDTPGHAAFTEMRARGAQVTDIVVLVVAADDGVMPQTVEALNHAKASGVQILVALNKCDRPNANPEKAKQQLMEHELVPEEYGGDTIFVPISALNGDGVEDLLDSINLLAEVGEYTANPDRHGEGSVLEARLEKGKGPVATLLVQHGTLKAGDRLVVGTTWGRVRAMTDYTNKRLKQAGPSTPVEIMGLEGVPLAGDNFVVVKTDKDAKALSQHRIQAQKDAAKQSTQKMTLEDILARRNAEELIDLNLIVKTDVGGTLEAIKGQFAKIDVEGTTVKVLHSAVGGITESDVTLAHTYGAIIIGFNVRPDAKARKAGDNRGVEIRTYKVIYEALEDVEAALKGLLGPSVTEEVQGTAEIRQTFKVPKIGTVAGCFVSEGKIARSHSIRLLRDGVIVWEGRLGSLRRFKDDVREVEKGYECGMNLDGFNDIKTGDVLEAFMEVQSQRS
jgi:translation initiation factor IF-2